MAEFPLSDIKLQSYDFVPHGTDKLQYSLCTMQIV